MNAACTRGRVGVRVQRPSASRVSFSASASSSERQLFNAKNKRKKYKKIEKVNVMGGRSVSVSSSAVAVSASVGLASAEAVLSKVSFGALMASTGMYWFKAAFTTAFAGDTAEQRSSSGDSSSGSSWREKELESEQNKIRSELILLMTANISLVLSLLYRWLDSGHFPLSNLYESLMFLGWGITSVQLWLQLKLSSPSSVSSASASSAAAGTITVPGALLVVAFAALLLPPELQRSSSLVPALKSNWLTMHVSVVMMSYACLLVGSMLSAGYLLLDQPEGSLLGRIRDQMPSFREKAHSENNEVDDHNQKKMSTNTVGSAEYSSEISDTISLDRTMTPTLPQLQQVVQIKGNDEHSTVVSSTLSNIDSLSYRSIGLGFAFLTVGIISGAVWANEAWGSYWSWDPKETWALITWLTYAMYLHARLSLEWKEKDVASLGAAGFMVVMICYIGVNLWGVGLHSYGFFSK